MSQHSYIITANILVPYQSPNFYKVSVTICCSFKLNIAFIRTFEALTNTARKSSPKLNVSFAIFQLLFGHWVGTPFAQVDSLCLL